MNAADTVIWFMYGHHHDHAHDELVVGKCRLVVGVMFCDEWLKLQKWQIRCRTRRA